MAEERREEPREIAEGRKRYEEAQKQDKESISSLSPDERGYESTGKYVYTGGSPLDIVNMFILLIRQ